ncbi:MAG: RNA polymerase sigma factor [Bacteroidota bacterium]
MLHAMKTRTSDTTTDEMLLAEALAGNKQALENLLKRYQDYIFNISLRLFAHPDDALDATQEVLIKIVTHLKTFNGKSQFKTWLFRIAVNHFLNTPRKKVEQFFDHRAPDNPLLDIADAPGETYEEALVEEVRLACSMAMLMCLNRDQRLIYIIGEIFGAEHQLGAELFGLSTANYRVRLHRARTDLLNYIAGRCGLVDPKNSCRCYKKTGAMIQKGFVDREKLVFNAEYTQKIHEIIATQRDAVSDDIKFRMTELFVDAPFQVKQELDDVLEGLLR